LVAYRPVEPSAWVQIPAPAPSIHPTTPDLSDDPFCDVDQEATKLVENGCEYATEMEGQKILEKRK
jgi:hypothetical protein